MTVRLHYLCPIKAAWAAKQLGVVFEDPNGLFAISNIVYAHDEFDELPPYYLHPDSVPVLLGLTADQKAAMQLLGLWPESEAA